MTDPIYINPDGLGQPADHDFGGEPGALSGRWPGDEPPADPGNPHGYRREFPEGANRPSRFQVAFGSCINAGEAQAVAERIAAENPDWFVTFGDIFVGSADGAWSDSWRTYFGERERQVELLGRAVTDDGYDPAVYRHSEERYTGRCDYGDILDRIDDAIGCQRCGRPLGKSPSDDFCGPGCQGAWHTARAASATAGFLNDGPTDEDSLVPGPDRDPLGGLLTLGDREQARQLDLTVPDGLQVGVRLNEPRPGCLRLTVARAEYGGARYVQSVMDAAAMVRHPDEPQFSVQRMVDTLNRQPPTLGQQAEAQLNRDGWATTPAARLDVRVPVAAPPGGTRYPRSEFREAR